MSQARRDFGVPDPFGRQRHLVEAVQDRGVAVPADAGHRRRAQVEAPVQIRRPERPGDRGLDRRDVADHDDVAVGAARAAPVGGEQFLAGGRDAHVHRGQRLAARRAEATVALPFLPDLGRDTPERLALELAVVHLDPALVDVDGELESRAASAVSTARRSGLERSSAPGARRTWARRPPGPGRTPSARRRCGPTAAPARSPRTRRGERGSARRGARAQAGMRMRPALLARRDLARRQRADALDLDRGELEVATVAVALDQTRRPGALQVGRATSRSGRTARSGSCAASAARVPTAEAMAASISRRSCSTWPRSSLARLSSGSIRAAQRGEFGIDGVLVEHDDELLLLELGAPLGEVLHLLVHGLQVAPRRSWSSRRGAAPRGCAAR